MSTKIGTPFDEAVGCFSKVTGLHPEHVEQVLTDYLAMMSGAMVLDEILVWWQAKSIELQCFHPDHFIRLPRLDEVAEMAQPIDWMQFACQRATKMIEENREYYDLFR